MTTKEPQPFIHTISVPRLTVWDKHRAHQLMEQLLFAFGSLTFRIVATREHTTWQVLDLHARAPSGLESAIRTSYPEATVSSEAFGLKELSSIRLYRRVIKYQYRVPLFVAPIQYATDQIGPDPLIALTHAMSELHDEERIIYTVAITGFADYAYKEGEKLIQRPVYDGSLRGLVFPLKMDRYTPELTRVLLAKLQQRLYEAAVLIQLDSPERDRLDQLVVIDNHMVQFDRPNFNGLCWINDASSHVVEVDTDKQDWDTSALGLYISLVQGEQSGRALQTARQTMRLVLEPRELANLWHLPHQDFTAPNVVWTPTQVRVPALMLDKREGVMLGVNEYAGRNEPVYLPDRSGHASLIGKAGVGKSTLLHHLIHQDIAAGQGVAVIDPHGQLISDILQTSIPAGRECDVILLDIANEDFPPPMNLLSVPSGVDRGNAAGQVMAVLDKIYGDFKETPTVADTLWATLVTLLHEETPTVRDLARLLSDPTYRARLVARVENPAVQEFWERFERYPNQQEQLSRPVIWRMRGFYANEALYPILCHPDTIDFAAAIAQKKIILMSLKTAEARIPAREQQLLGTALMKQIQLAVMSRAPGSPPYYLYIDEVQQFTTTPLEVVLSEARKFGLHLIVANQYLKQLTGSTLDALLGNVGAMVVFQCGLEDAKALAPYMMPGFDSESLINLNKFEAVVKMRYRDQTQPAFSLRTLAPLVSTVDASKARERERTLRRLAITNYTPKSREAVMAWLKQRYTPPSSTSASRVGAVDFEPLP